MNKATRLIILAAAVSCLCAGIVATTATAAQNSDTAAASGDEGKDNGKAEKLTITTSDGFRITVVEASRVGRSWKGHVFFTYSAPEGSEIVVLRVNIERLGEKDTFEAEAAELLLADGSKSISPVKSLSYSFPDKGDQDAEVPFIVLPGFKLKVLQLGTLTFDLSTLSVTDKTPKTTS